MPSAGQMVSTRSKLTSFAIAVLLVTIAEYIVFAFVTGQGVALTGDEPHYLVIAMSLTHLDPHVVWAYERVNQTQYIATGSHGSVLVTDAFRGPHGYISVHDIGLSALIAPFFAVGGTGFALLGYKLLLAICIVTLHRRASKLAGLGSTGQWAFAIAMAGPALWLATVQLYPDLISGLFLAIAFVEIGLLERTGEIRWYGIVALGIGLGFAPWLNFKNLVSVGIGLIALTVIAWRARLPIKRLGMIYVLIAIFLLPRAAYNIYFIGHLLGLPQAPPNLSSDGIATILGLVFDRHQGMLVQLPTLVLGLVGMALAIRKIAFAVVAAALAAASLIVINGTYTIIQHDPSSLNGLRVIDAYGNLSFAGRYQWSVIPIVIAFIPFCLGTIEPHRRRLKGLMIAMGSVWTMELVPILFAHHTYFNSTMAPFAVWDPTLYPGWWGWVNHLLPAFYGFGFSLSLTSTWFGISWELLIVAVGIVLLSLLGRERPLHVRRMVTIASMATIGFLLVAQLGPRQILPFQPQAWTSADLGTSVANTSGGPLITTPIALTGVGTGEFRARLTYHLASIPSQSATVSIAAQAQASGLPLFQPPSSRIGVTLSPLVAGVGELVPQKGVASSVFDVRVTRTSSLSIQFSLGQSQVVQIYGLQLTRLN